VLHHGGRPTGHDLSGTNPRPPSSRQILNTHPALSKIGPVLLVGSGNRIGGERNLHAEVRYVADHADARYRNPVCCTMTRNASISLCVRSTSEITSPDTLTVRCTVVPSPMPGLSGITTSSYRPSPMLARIPPGV